MSMKGVLQSDHIPVNKYRLIVVGLAVPEVVLTSIGSIEKELDKIDLPDRTVASGGRTGPVEFDVEQPMHHTAEVAAMELWFQEGQDPVTPTYKKPATLVLESLSGARVKTFSFPDLFVRKQATPDFEMDNEGEMASLTWTLCASDILPI